MFCSVFFASAFILRSELSGISGTEIKLFCVPQLQTMKISQEIGQKVELSHMEPSNWLEYLFFKLLCDVNRDNYVT